MNDQQADMIRMIMESQPNWAEIVELFPTFASAISKLPDESGMIYALHELRCVYQDCKAMVCGVPT